MDKITIITNNVPREVIYGYTLSEKERLEFNYYNWTKIALGQDDDPSFFRYKGQLYDLGEFQATYGMPEFNPITKWDLYHSDSFFSGILVKWSYADEDDYESVTVGRFFT